MQGLKEQRLSLKMTQKELAQTFGISETTWATWERGEVEPNAPGMLELALEALQARVLINKNEFIERKNKIKASMEKMLSESRQRIKHSKVTE